MNSIRRTARSFIDWQAKQRHRNLSQAFKVQSHLTVLERVRLHELSRGKTHIAEIGSYIGASACCFGAAASDTERKKIICIDTWNNDAMTEGNRDTWAEFKSNTADFSVHVIPVRGFSTDVVDQVRAIIPTLDLLFIDGDHSYDGVKADWEAYKSFLKPGSTVIFHDYGWAEGVKRVVHEDVMPLVLSHDILPNMWWGTLAK
jgi:predicted O-methyltransferase YrrM